MNRTASGAFASIVLLACADEPTCPPTTIRAGARCISVPPDADTSADGGNDCAGDDGGECAERQPPSREDAGSESPGDGGTATDSETTVDPAGGEPATQTPFVGALALESSRFVCKVINGAGIDEETANRTHTRFNLAATDLGIPLQVDDTTYLFFGDSIGYKRIWPSPAEVDAIGSIKTTSLRADPAAVCRSLDVLVTDEIPSVAHQEDPRIARDFAGIYIDIPAQAEYGDFISAGSPACSVCPGALEVPSGALRFAQKSYVFYSAKPEQVVTSSFLARWDDVRSTKLTALTSIDDTTRRHLGGHFIQVAGVAGRDSRAYFFGTGAYRQSGIYIARSESVEDPKTWEVLDPDNGKWLGAADASPEELAALRPSVETDGVGELSVFAFEGQQLYGLLYQHETRNPDGAIVRNVIQLRVAESPEGPWSDPVALTDMGDADFRSEHCCKSDRCEGSQLLHCDRAGLYAAYALPGARAEGNSLYVPFLTSTWDPYNVVLFEARVRID